MLQDVGALLQVAQPFACAARALVSIGLFHATAALAHELAEAYHGSKPTLRGRYAARVT